ncbi:MAG TPA: hypothetical protein VL357_04290 [Rariglobus sp.]|nr:hypothetical protein [Rariglobus sp.]
MNIIYAAHGEFYFKEAVKSAKSLLRFQTANIYIYTNIRVDVWKGDSSIKIRPLPEFVRPTISKVYALCDFEKQSAIYLDTDTKILGSLEGLWMALEQYDFIIANEPANLAGFPFIHPYVKYKCVYTYNAGVFAFRRSDSLTVVFKKWSHILSLASDEDIKIAANRNDQQVLNELIVDEKLFEKLNILVVDNLKYNVRGGMFRQMRRDGLWGGAIILHCHSLYSPLRVKLWHKLIAGFRLIKSRF